MAGGGRRKPRSRSPGGRSGGPGAARGPVVVPGTPPILAVRLKVDLPRGLWTRAFTRAHPDLDLQIVNRMEIGRGLALVEVRVLGRPLGDWGAEIAALPGVEDVQMLGSGERFGLYRITYRGDPILPVLRRLRLLGHFPIPVRKGVATWTVVGPQGTVRRFLREVGNISDGVAVDSIRSGPDYSAGALLTPRQEEILRRAINDGYFDVPRRITLTQLAPRLGVAVSTLSVMLALIERKILQPRIDGGEDPAG